MKAPNEEKKGKQKIRHPKVKTGCITCRNRRVKCDEARPQCVRCQKYGTVCEGYLPGRRRPPSSAYGSFAVQARALVPKNFGENTLFINPNLGLFENNQDFQYFNLFADRIATEIWPYFNSDNWTQMILQACASESSIRHAAIAIGALGKAYELASIGQCTKGFQEYMLGKFERLPPPGTTRESRFSQGPAREELVSQGYSHHRNALEQYDKAIKCMRNDISNGTQSLRTTLIICIIIICFEAIHGNHESAAGQLQGGLALIQDWKSRQTDSERHPQGFSSPAPDVVEDFLVQLFGRMEIQSMSVFDPRPVQIHQALKNEGKETIENMPNPFSSLEQARIYLDLITRRLMHFNRTIHVQNSPTPGSSANPTTQQTAQSPTENPISSTTSLPFRTPNTPRSMPWIEGKLSPTSLSSTLSSTSSPLLLEQRLLNNELLSWMTSFAPLLTYSRAIGGLDAVSALTISISALSSQISLRAAFFGNEMSYDVFEENFRTIVECAGGLLGIQKQILGGKVDGDGQVQAQVVNSPPLGFEGGGSPVLVYSGGGQVGSPQGQYPTPPEYNTGSLNRTPPPPPPPPQPIPPPQNQHQFKPPKKAQPVLHFTFEIGVVPPLYLVAIKCRNSKLRREALRLLEKNPRREGVWDSAATVQLGKWVIELEEEGARKLRERERGSASPPGPVAEFGDLGVGLRLGGGGRRGGRGRGSVGSIGEWERLERVERVGSWGSVEGFIGGEWGEEKTREEEEDSIPEKIRVRKAAMRFDLLERRANMSCVQMDVETGVFVEKKEVFYW